MVRAPAQVRGEELDRSARPVDLGKHAQPFLALFVEGTVGSEPREHADLVSCDGPLRQHGVTRARAVVLEVVGVHRLGAPERVGELDRLAPGVVLPHLLQGENVGVDRPEVLDDHGEPCLPGPVAPPEVPRGDAHAGGDEGAVARVVLGRVGDAR